MITLTHIYIAALLHRSSINSVLHFPSPLYVRLLEQIGYLGNDVHPVKLYGDNEPSIQLVSAEGHHERTKHVDIYYHYIKDRVKEGHISLQHVRTHDMAADGLTKPLDKLAHRRFLDQVGLRKPIINSALTHVPAQD
jgi:hypothetical protein